MAQIQANFLAYQDSFLAELQEAATPVFIYLRSGIKLQGCILAFDAHVIILRAGAISQIVYKHSVLTILPQKDEK